MVIAPRARLPSATASGSAPAAFRGFRACGAKLTALGEALTISHMTARLAEEVKSANQAPGRRARTKAEHPTRRSKPGVGTADPSRRPAVLCGGPPYLPAGDLS